jgi:hypothetical protein
MKRLAIFVVLLGLFGCHGGAKSKLAGGWVLDSGKVVSNEEGTIVSKSVCKRDSDQEPAVVIRDDATFHWFRTVLSIIGMYTGRQLDLRHKGDRVDFIDEDSGEHNGYVEITESQYSESSSCLMIYMDDRFTGKRTSASYSARLRSDGKMDYEYALDEDGINVTTLTAVMKRYGKPLAETWKSPNPLVRRRDGVTP